MSLPPRDGAPSGAPLLPPPPSGDTPWPAPHRHAPTPWSDRANGFAIAALLCGLAGLVPVAPLLAIVFGVIALRQLRRAPQRGRGMAVAGVVLGSVGVVFWAVVGAAVLVADDPARTAATPGPSGSTSAGAPPQTSGRVLVEDLTPGACFSGIGPASLDWASLSRCDVEHEMQLITIVELDAGPFPGRDEAGAEAERTCMVAVEPLVDESKLERVELFVIYPDSRVAWAQDRSVLCVAASADGALLHSVLK
ncbi:DUF4190 domain-containing protein [Intrasporangium sp. DVR]|uniref:DUF4190 domain-containing protein n=1 Tax=Intrasporangium sp. DVR TaxID=3127867 RepID=UPI00313A602F